MVNLNEFVGLSSRVILFDVPIEPTDDDRT